VVKQQTVRKEEYLAMRQKSYYLFAITFLILRLAETGLAQEPRASSFEVRKTSENNIKEYSGGLLITVDGKQKQIADRVSNAWIIDDGREVVYSGQDGAGGYEGEGQSLHLYDVKSGATRKIMAHYYIVLGLSEHKLKSGRRALLVRMADSGLGASYFSVVDPRRGEVFSESFAELSSLDDDKFNLAFYREDDWSAVNEARDAAFYEETKAFPARKATAKPEKHKTYDLNQILKNKVIERKHTMEYLDAGLKWVEIYFWRVNDEQPNKNFVLGPVRRQVDLKAPLRLTLEELFEGVTTDEAEKGYGSPTFGMKFEGVVLRNGVATVKFSQPAGETNYGSLGPFIFRQAIEQTVRQFSVVKRVEICAVGTTLIDAQLERQFPRCAKN
jgi:hypothetical protein